MDFSVSNPVCVYPGAANHPLCSADGFAGTSVYGRAELLPGNFDAEISGDQHLFDD